MTTKLKDIIDEELIHSSFQPIVSLQTADVYGYEVLSCIDKEVCSENGPSISSLFAFAEQNNCLWELEKLCRKKALKTAHAFGVTGKLFLKTAARIIEDKSFTSGYTLKKIEKYAMNPDTIVLELNERFGTADLNALKELYNHYGEQNFHIAIDNMGMNYTELLCALNPDYIKIAMSITRNISSDEVKKSIVQSLVQFCKSTGTILIAQGIETATQLETLISLGVPYGQGYFIAKPDIQPKKTEAAACACIFKKTFLKEQEKEEQKEKKKEKTNFKKIVIPKAGGSRSIGMLCLIGITVPPNTPAVTVLALFQKETECNIIVIASNKGKIEGCITRSHMMNLFGGQYGYSLNAKKLIRDIMETDFLCVDSKESVEQVAALSTARDEEHLYTPVIVSENGKYAGIVTIQNLLDSIITVEVKERTQEITRKNKLLQEIQLRAQRDMKMAELVQKSFYPSKAPETEQWDCAFLFKPMSSVSGDVYDFYYNGKELAGASLFDVSGHGVASGLVGILSKYLASSVFEAEQDKPLENVIADLNNFLVKEKGNVENYLTGVLLRINGSHIEYVNAGHTDILIKSVPPLAGKNTTSTVQKSLNTKMKNVSSPSTVSILGGAGQNFRGHFLGVPDLPIDCTSIEEDIASGSCLMLYTDCLTESRNLAGDELGIERLSSIFNKAPISSAKNALNYVVDIFDTYTEAVPLRDDLTILMLKKK